MVLTKRDVWQTDLAFLFSSSPISIFIVVCFLAVCDFLVDGNLLIQFSTLLFLSHPHTRTQKERGGLFQRVRFQRYTGNLNQ